jgi:hypothetical protein
MYLSTKKVKSIIDSSITISSGLCDIYSLKHTVKYQVKYN